MCPPGDIDLLSAMRHLGAPTLDGAMIVCPACGAENPDRARFCLDCGTRLQALPVATTPSRRTVTILFSDVIDSTALGESLDPEALRSVMASYFGAMRAAIERHSGTVEKFIGDAIMAVFGLTAIHEDDALRAVRAALEMRDALTALNAHLASERGLTIGVRTGIHSGEVAAGDAGAGQLLATGDAVNTAARLEQAAGAGEILLADSTIRLVRDAVVAEEVPAVLAKGKAQPLRAYRLVGLRPRVGSLMASPTVRLVGRGSELRRMRAAYGRVRRSRRAVAVTIVGPAGVGKTRLLAAFLAGAGAVKSGAARTMSALRGRHHLLADPGGLLRRRRHPGHGLTERSRCPAGAPLDRRARRRGRVRPHRIRRRPERCAGRPGRDLLGRATCAGAPLERRATSRRRGRPAMGRTDAAPAPSIPRPRRWRPARAARLPHPPRTVRPAVSTRRTDAARHPHRPRRVGCVWRGRADRRDTGRRLVAR